mmetsp:Transcript_29435/g.52709  ORF Transcript_29435/g.52709 Transcript_29435/m.52709 type:complete len:281 (-) Transcript_29435:25-867(-)
MEGQANSKLDDEFIKHMTEIEAVYVDFNKHEKIRVEQWSKKLCQVTVNPVWKKNRNAYAKLLLEMVHKKVLSDPFSKVPPSGPLPQLPRTGVYVPARVDKSSSPKVVKTVSEPSTAPKVKVSQTVKQLFPEEPIRQMSPRSKVPTETRILQDQILKLQAQLETSNYTEGLLRQEIERRDTLIDSQRKMIGELRAELGAYKQQSTKPEGKFLDYLEEFQAETARLTAETEALLTKHERKVPPLNTMHNLEQLTHQNDILEDLLGLQRGLPRDSWGYSFPQA